MAEHHRAFIYIMVLSLPALYLAQVALRSIIDERELRLWRNAWIFSTASFFLSGSILIYAILIGALSIYVHRVSPRPVFLYIVLLLTAPAVGVNLGIPGLFGSILELSPARILSIAFLLPAAVVLVRDRWQPTLSITDRLVAAFVLLLFLLTLRYGSPTYTMRAAAIILLDIALPYFVFSRSCRDTQSIRTMLTAILFAALPFAMAGLFEFVRGWRLYDGAIQQWGIVLIQSYLFRDGMLRAASSAIEPISFGFVCMVACGCLLAIRDHLARSWMQVAMAALLCFALIAGLSRGPWLGMAVLIAMFACVRPQGIRNLVKVATIAALPCMLLLFSSYGDRIVRLLPFVGSVETSNEDYRATLIDATIAVVGRNPLFGSIHFRTEPEILAMIQGQGIVDIVNTYAAIALEFGLVALASFVATFASVLPGLFVMSFKADPSQTSLVRGMLATLVAILLTIGTVSSVSVIPYIYWAFLGACMAVLRSEPQTSQDAKAPTSPRLVVLGR